MSTPSNGVCPAWPRPPASTDARARVTRQLCVLDSFQPKLPRLVLLEIEAVEQRLAPLHHDGLSETISVADLGLFGQLQSFRTPLTRSHAQQLELRERLSGYLARVDAATRVQRGSVHAGYARAV